MKIDIITMWYNEEFLAPFFLQHYHYADTIHIMLDEETTDSTEKIISQYDNTDIIWVRFPDMLDDIIKVEKINRLYRSLDCDWVIAVDSDEFIFTLPLEQTVRHILENENRYNLYFVQLWQVFRHRNDYDLDPKKPALFQRRHGDPNISEGRNALYIKPIVVRSSINITWDVGCHRLMKKNPLIQKWDNLIGKDVIPSPQLLYGAHWDMADPVLALKRRLKKKEHLSKRNFETGLGYQNFYVTEKDLMGECNQHLNDPQLF